MPGKPSYAELEQQLKDLKQKINLHEQEKVQFKEKETRERLILRTLPMAFYIAYPYGDYGGTWVSEQIEAISGFSPHKFIDNPELWASRLHPDDRKRVLSSFDELESRKIITNEYRWQVADDSYKWFYDGANIVFDSDGKPIHIIGIWLDITESKQAQEEVEESNLKFRELVDMLPQIVFETDIKGNLTFVNNQAYSLTGYGPEDFREGVNAVALLVEEDRQKAAENLQRVREGYKSQRGNEYTMVRKDGSRFPVLAHSMPIQSAEATVGFRGIIVDISSLKKAEEALRASEERYRTLFESASDMIHVVNPEGRLLYANPSWCQVLGYCNEEAVGMNVYDILDNGCVDECRGHFQNTLVVGRVEHIETVFRAKDGRKVHLEGSLNTKYSAGKPDSVQCIFRDVTERRKLVEEIGKAHKLESIGILAGGIAHDFNNILTAIAGNISLARMYSKPGERAHDRLGEAEKALLRARDLTQQLLTFSKGGGPVTQTTSISGIIKDSSSFALRGSNVKCELNLPDELWPVEADAGQISQVVHNLVINADQAMPEGGKITITAENIDTDTEKDIVLKPGRYVAINISDQGLGIHEKHLAKIFDPYFSTKQKGHGLGLATAYSIIKNHKGLLTGKSELGKGSVFSFYLPASFKKPSRPKSDEAILYKGEGMILLMDDEEGVREVASEMLQNLGYEVHTASDGQKALEMYIRAEAENKPYVAVIMDLTVPGGLGGNETIQKLREIDPAVKAIVSSGYANNSIMANYETYGFVGVVPKPYIIQELGAVLQKVLEG